MIMIAIGDLFSNGDLKFDEDRDRDRDRNFRNQTNALQPTISKIKGKNLGTHQLTVREMEFRENEAKICFFLDSQISFLHGQKQNINSVVPKVLFKSKTSP